MQYHATGKYARLAALYWQCQYKVQRRYGAYMLFSSCWPSLSPLRNRQMLFQIQLTIHRIFSRYICPFIYWKRRMGRKAVHTYMYKIHPAILHTTSWTRGDVHRSIRVKNALMFIDADSNALDLPGPDLHLDQTGTGTPNIGRDHLLMDPIHFWRILWLISLFFRLFQKIQLSVH